MSNTLPRRSKCYTPGDAEYRNNLLAELEEEKARIELGFVNAEGLGGAGAISGEIPRFSTIYPNPTLETAGFSALTAYTECDDVVTELAAAPWGVVNGRRYFHVILFKNNLWLFGGDFAGGGNSYSDVWRSPDGINWVLDNAAPGWNPRGRYACGVVHNGIDDAVLLVGGAHDGVGGWQDAWIMTWDGINPSVWAQTSAGVTLNNLTGIHGVSFNNTFWFFGGDINNNQAFSTGFGPAVGAVWTPLLNMPFSLTNGIIWASNKIYAGLGTTGLSFGSTIDGNNWNVLPLLFPFFSQIYGGKATLFDSAVIGVGGDSFGGQGQGFITILPPNFDTSYYGMSRQYYWDRYDNPGVVTFNGRIWIFGTAVVAGVPQIGYRDIISFVPKKAPIRTVEGLYLYIKT